MNIKLSKDLFKLIENAYDKLGGPKPASDALKVTFVLTTLLEQWDLLQQDEMLAPLPLPLPSSLEEAMRSITEPDVSLPLSVKHDKTTPRATDGLVPWEYIVAGYSNLEFVASVVKDYTNKGEQCVAVIRQILTRIPEDQWESEQTKSIATKALIGVGL